MPSTSATKSPAPKTAKPPKSPKAAAHKKTTAKPKKSPKKPSTKPVEEDSKSRSFTIVKVVEKKSGVETTDVGGRYISKRPKAVSMKSFSQYAKTHKDFKGALKVYMRETTRGDNGNVFVYEVSRVTLDEPLVVKREGKDIVYKFKMMSESLKEERKEFMKKLAEESGKTKPEPAKKAKQAPSKKKATKSPVKSPKA